MSLQSKQSRSYTSLKERKDLKNKLNSSKRYFNYPIAKLTDLAGKYVIIRFFIDKVETKLGKDRFLLIVDTVDEDKLKEQEKQPDEEIEIRDGNTYKVFSSSKILKRSLRLLSETDPTVFPILVKLKKEVRESKKTGNKYTIYDIEVE